MSARQSTKARILPTLLQRPYLAITAVFVLWKILLVTLVLLTPGPSYDTSTAIHLSRLQSKGSERSTSSENRSLLWRLCEGLTRWDAIYFTQASHHGYRNEQEWAFGWGYVKAITTVHKGLEAIVNRNFGPMSQIFTAIVFSNASHLFSALALYRLSTLVFNNTEPTRQAIPLVSAVLHVLSPAGLFLAAPYSESPFSLLTMTGYCLYAQAGKSRRGMPRYLALFMSAILLSVSCTVRSNGILHGIPFLVDFILELRQLGHNFSLAPLLNIVALGICGLLIAGGFMLPQAIAWRQFCLDTPMKAGWCQNTIPSIYFWIQDRYWNVGFLRYWTIPNIPLFALAMPALYVLLKSGQWGLRAESIGASDILLLRKLALPQIALASMAITSYHVQIITRLSSGCAVWYWYVASQAIGSKEASNSARESYMVVKWMVMYALIQGVLFASFLPPA